MNIWIFNHYAHPPDLPGGTRHFDLSRELVRGGHRVTVFASSFHHYMHRETRLQLREKWRVEEVEGVRFVWIRTPPYTGNDWRRVCSMMAFMIRAQRLGRRLPRLVPDTDIPNVIIGSSPHLLAPLAAWRAACHHGAALVMEVRDLWPQTIIDMGEMPAGHAVIRALRSLELFLYRRADRIITLLPLAHEYITGCGVSREKVVWVPNGVDLARLEGTVPEDARGHDGNEFWVMYLGAHGKANALDIVIEAAHLIQERGDASVRIGLVGDGPEKPRLVGLAQELGVRNVEFRDPVPKSKVAGVLREADALLLNLGAVEVFRYGISSNKLFDYMAASRPVILAVDAPENPVEKARCGRHVPAGDPQALADAIARLAQMPREEREAMGRRGRAYVEEHHDIRVLAEKLESVLSEVVHGP